MIHESRGQYIGALAYMGEERREVQVRIVRLLKKVMQQQYVRGTRWFGDYDTAAAVDIVLPYYPPELVCTWHTKR